MRRVLAILAIARARPPARSPSPRAAARRRRPARTTRSSSTTRSASSRAPTSRSPASAPARHRHALDRETQARAGRHRGHQDGLRLAAHRRLLRDPPAVADRRVLPRLPARHAPPGARARRRRSRSSRRLDDPADLVNNIMRRPYRERLRIILGELGVGVGGRGDDIKATRPPRRPRAARDRPRAGDPRRAEPDARPTCRATPTRVLGDLAGNREDVGRLVAEARADRPPTRPSAATRSPPASSACPASCASSSRRWPSSAGPPTRRRRRCATSTPPPASSSALLREPRPFADASRTGFTSLGRASPRRPPGACAPRSPTSPSCNAVRRRARPSSANNLAIVLEDLDDRDRAVEQDPRSPGGKGYTASRRCCSTSTTRRWRSTSTTPTATCSRSNLFPTECSDYQNLAVAEGEAQGGPRLLRALRRDPRPEPAGRHPARPDVHRRAGAAPSAAAPRDQASAAPDKPKARRPTTAGRRRPGAQSDELDKARAQGGREARASSSRTTLGIELPDLPAGPRRPAQLPVPLPSAPAGQRARRRRPSSSSTSCSRHEARVRRRRQPRARRRGRPCSSSSSPSSSPTTPTTACRSCRPTTLKVQLANGANLVKGNEVRSGGFRVGVVTDMRPVRLDGRVDRRRADAEARQGASATSRTTRRVRIRPRSALGLKYVELTAGTSERDLRQRRHDAAVAGHVPGRARRGLQDVRRADARRRRRRTCAASATRFAGRGAGPRPHDRGAARRCSSRSSR